MHPIESYNVTFVHLWTHGQLDDKPGGVPQDEGGDEVPVDDVSQAADAPVRRAEGNKLRRCCAREKDMISHREER